MQRLCDRDDIRRAIREAAVLCRGDAIPDARVDEGVLQLARTRIGPHDVCVVPRQASRGLAVPRRTIPRQIVPGGVCGQPFEQRVRVPGRNAEY